MVIHKELIDEMIKGVLVYDIETSSFHPSGKPIDIRREFDDYVKYAKVKWVGCYSYKYDKYYEFNAITQRDEIINIFKSHKTYVGCNNEAFDTPVMVNNKLLEKKYKKELDVQVILGNNLFKGHKKRSVYMGVDLKPVHINNKKYGPNTLMSLAHHFDLPVLKGDIEYELFYQDEWDTEETKTIIKYLHGDVEVTKLLFDKLIDFWILFTDWLYEDDIKKWTWIKSSIASLTYCAACKVKGVQPTYTKARENEKKEEMGGRAVDPIQEESFNVHYMDEASKYPHTFSEFNLFSEVDVSFWTQERIDTEIAAGRLFHGNKLFKLKGYYDITEHGVMEIDLITKLKTRFAIKAVLKDLKWKPGTLTMDIPKEINHIITSKDVTEQQINILKGLEYAIKIFANSLYGAVRSSIFEGIHTKNAGYDCCWIGQQIHEYVENFFGERGYKIVGGFTDSWFFEMKEEEKDMPQKERELIMKKLSEECMNELKAHMPFPADTHIIDYETNMDYLLYNYNESERRYMKNNYCYISKGKVKIVGFPIMKNNATKLSIKIFNEVFKPYGLEHKRLKFERKEVRAIIIKELEEDITLVGITKKVKPSESYKNLNQIESQISRAYCDGLDGEITLIKNTRYGKVGKGDKYCTIDESKNLRFEDLILDKVWNELEPFIIQEKIVSVFDFIESEDEDSLWDEDDNKADEGDNLFDCAFEGKVEITIKKDKGIDSFTEIKETETKETEDDEWF